MNRPPERSEEFLGEIRLGRSLTTAGHVAIIGLTILVGLVFLLLGEEPALHGPWMAVASMLAILALGLTLLSAVELMGGSGERGGTYVLVQETWGGMGAFLAGWSILAGSSALVAALARAAAASVLFALPALGVRPIHIALLLFGALVLAQLTIGLPRRVWLWPLLFLLLVTIGISAGAALPHVSTSRVLSSTVPSSFELIRAVGGLMALYGIFEALLLSRRQISDPSRLLPRAVLSVLVTSSLALAGVGLLASGLEPEGPSSGMRVAGVLVSAGFLPRWVGGLMSLGALLLAMDGCQAVAVRQLHILSREGALPAELRRSLGPFSFHPLLFLLLVVLVVPLIVIAPTRWLTQVSSAMFLVAMVLLNVAAIHSYRFEPERRRPFAVPFQPLGPSLAIAVNLLLLAAMPLPAVAVWMLVGVAIYLGYARRHEVAAHEGVLVFGRGRREGQKDVYRILVPLASADERQLPLNLAVALARQLKGEVVPLQVIPVRDPLAIEEARRIAEERNVLFRWSTRIASDAQVPMVPITRLARTVPQGILDSATEEQCDLILMSWPGQTATPGARMGRVLDPVVRRAPCDVAVVAYHTPSHPSAGQELSQEDRPTDARPEQISEILVPTAGGPHAPVAIRLAVLIGREHGASVTALWVAVPEMSQADVAQGRRRVEETIAAVREELARLPSLGDRATSLQDVRVESRVIAADSVVEGILEGGAASDLLLIGASEEGLIDQVLFGSVPEQVARESSASVVMVKHYPGLSHFWLQRAWDTLAGALPQLSLDEQIDIYRLVRRGARPDADFFVMMGLAAFIATFGLLLDSAAVIIGAMLVAPLFTPIVAFKLAIVRGDARLSLSAMESTLKGVALATGVAVVLTALSPLKAVTPQIASRIQPNLFDLAVALASGAAGAYATARRDVAASLPGVAIAAALVPPLCVVGIGIAMMSLPTVGGAALLFATNLIAIVLAGSVVLLLLGFRPARRGGRRLRLQIGLVAAAGVLVLITIPLATVFVQTVRASRAESMIQATLEQRVAQLAGAELVSVAVERQGGSVQVTATLYAGGRLDASLATELSDELSQAIGSPVYLRLAAIQVTEASGGP